jgi:hypothetical protein
MQVLNTSVERQSDDRTLGHLNNIMRPIHCSMQDSNTFFSIP